MAAPAPDRREDDSAAQPPSRRSNPPGEASPSAPSADPSRERPTAAPARSLGLSASSAALVRLAVVLLLIGAGAGVWEILASQPPPSPFNAGILAGPFAQVRRTATTIALVLFAGAWLLPWAAPRREPRKLVAAVYIGVLLTMGAMLYAASRGMMAVQILDPRLDAKIAFGVRAAGQAILGLCLLDFARRVVMRRRADPPA